MAVQSGTILLGEGDPLTPLYPSIGASSSLWLGWKTYVQRLRKKIIYLSPLNCFRRPFLVRKCENFIFRERLPYPGKWSAPSQNPRPADRIHRSGATPQVCFTCESAVCLVHPSRTRSRLREKARSIRARCTRLDLSEDQCPRLRDTESPHFQRRIRARLVFIRVSNYPLPRVWVAVESAIETGVTLREFLEVLIQRR